MEIGVKVDRETRRKEVRIEMKWESPQKTTRNSGCGDKSEEMTRRGGGGVLDISLSGEVRLGPSNPDPV